ncbi:MAG: CDP-alcohol phosphatidyltransferase family protein, partial [Pseudomonadota bacterium]
MSEDAGGSLRLVGNAAGTLLFGLPIEDWQRRNWARAGVGASDGVVVADARWVLSTPLAAAIARRPGAALVEAGNGGSRLVAAHAGPGVDPQAVAALIETGDAGEAEAAAIGLSPGDAAALAGSYNWMLRKRETPFAIDVAREGAAAAERALFRSSYKGVTDLVTKHVWPAPALVATRWCAARRISPNSVTTASLILVFAAMWFFWHGQWAAGFAAGWLMTFLDTVDGKLARTTLTSSRFGDVYDHGIDLIHPPFWYWAWAEGVRAGGPAPGWLDAALGAILATYVLDRAIEATFKRVHGFHVHVWERGDSLLREFGARRNPNMLLFMLFCLVG